MFIPGGGDAPSHKIISEIFYQNSFIIIEWIRNYSRYWRVQGVRVTSNIERIHLYVENVD